MRQVLIISKQYETVTELTLITRSLGFKHIDSASDSKMVRTKLYRDPPNVIICDMDMNQEELAVIKRALSGPLTHIVLMPTPKSDTNMRYLEQMGDEASHFLMSPMDKGKLHYTLDTILRVGWTPFFQCHARSSDALACGFMEHPSARHENIPLYVTWRHALCAVREGYPSARCGKNVLCDDLGMVIPGTV